jgi:hypothetical protein
MQPASHGEMLMLPLLLGRQHDSSPHTMQHGTCESRRDILIHQSKCSNRRTQARQLLCLHTHQSIEEPYRGIPKYQNAAHAHAHLCATDTWLMAVRHISQRIASTTKRFMGTLGANTKFSDHEKRARECDVEQRVYTGRREYFSSNVERCC